ncbi:zinc-ribbon domain-containing protein [Vallitalea pronyensis]|uniref:Zinc-ribbon domain-containing protein n=1 Tax=Vallitalea pronyensis TaxID=1348613 RepID=A0A8J8MJP4_9FIRM|nr:zinc-ribbon domain-containing protein [Vallitalea pronyensis]QUI22657.1 zinc-ribbon domain-containing protein [Vallitalea pronyensis]
MTYYCPSCKGELSEETGCGSVSYFCNHCKKLISRQSILKKEQVDEQKDDKR